MDSFYLMAGLITRDSFLIIKFKGKDSTTMAIKFIKAFGSIMKKVGMDAWNGRMVIDIKASFYMIRCTERVNFMI